jgi:RNA polymerase sigma-70 factor (ECF subfamily)
MTPYASHTDHELFALIATGDEAAFAEIYLRYTEKLYPHVAKLLDADDWAEEIVQDVFTKLWQVRESLTTIENPNAYLYRMAANRTIDHMRKMATEVKMQYHIARQAEDHLRAETATGEKLDARMAGIKEVVEQLSPQRKLVFKLRHEEGLSYEEIAQQLNLSKSAVRDYLRLALQTIREGLRTKGIFIFFSLF